MTEPGRLEGRVAVVTGATGGLGLAIVRAYAGAGARVALIARDEEKLEKVAASLPDPSRVLIQRADVTDAGALRDAALAVGERWGTVSVLCAAAGIMHTGGIDTVAIDTWHELVATNVTGPVLTMRAFLPLLDNPSSVLLIASTAGLRAVPDFAAYTTTKAAIVHLTQACALDWASRGIRVNCICPGVIPGPIHESLGWPSSDMLYETMTAATPLGYLGEPADVAHLALFLADPGSHWLTGSVLVVDGGLSLV